MLISFAVSTDPLSPPLQARSAPRSVGAASAALLQKQYGDPRVRRCGFQGVAWYQKLRPASVDLARGVCLLTKSMVRDMFIKENKTLDIRLGMMRSLL